MDAKTNVDIVLGYPWMKSLGIININAKKKIETMVQERKITLQDVSCIKQEEPKKALATIATRNLVVIPTHPMMSLCRKQQKMIHTHR